jgi:hypothetical protein
MEERIMLNRSNSNPTQAGNLYGQMSDSRDVGEVSDFYASHQDRQAVHDIYELGNEVAALKNEPVFDNRVGFTDQFDQNEHALDDDVRTASHFDNGQYGEGGKADQEVDQALRHHMLPGDQPGSISKSQPGSGASWADEVAGSASASPEGADLNNADPTPPQETQERLDAAKQPDFAGRTNDSSIDPDKPKNDILKGFHGG